MSSEHESKSDDTDKTANNGDNIANKQQSCFDSIVCCVCTRSIFSKYSINIILWSIICVMALIGCIINDTYYGRLTEDMNNHYGDIHTAGLTLHFLSLALATIFSMYPGRYLSGYQHDQKDNSHIYSTYWLCFFYMVTIIVFYSRIADGHDISPPKWTSGPHNHKVDINLIPRCSEGIIIYFISAQVLWFMNVVFRPIIPHWCNLLHLDSDTLYIDRDSNEVEDDKEYNCFVNFFSKYGVYEEVYGLRSTNGVWSSVSLLMPIIVGISMINLSFATYYVGATHHTIMITLSILSFIIACFLQTLILYSVYKRKKIFDTESGIFTSYIFCAVFWGIASVVLFFVYYPYNGRNIDPKFPTESMARNVFFMVQGFPFVMVIGITILYLIVKCLKLCKKCITLEVGEAQAEVDGFNEVTVELETE
jgi:hypothetical protein